MTPRTASTAVAEYLRAEHGGEFIPERNILDANGLFLVPRKHCTLAQLIEHGLLSEEETRRLYVFAGVRNPFDSIASLYVKLRDSYQPLLAEPDSWIHQVRGYAEQVAYCRDHTFDEWLAAFYVPRLRGRIRDLVLGRRGRSMFARYVAGADSIVRFETLEEGVTGVLDRVGVRHRTRLPFVNPTEGRRPDYRTYYSVWSRRFVERRYRPDLAMYGYEF